MAGNYDRRLRKSGSNSGKSTLCATVGEDSYRLCYNRSLDAINVQPNEAFLEHGENRDPKIDQARHVDPRGEGRAARQQVIPQHPNSPELPDGIPGG